MKSNSITTTIVLCGALVAAQRHAFAQATMRASVNSSGAQGNHYSETSFVSPDGRFVAFMSYASNLVKGDTNGTDDVFVHDRVTGTTERASVDSSGVEGNNYSYSPFPPSISADGRYIAFQSAASNLVAGDTNGLEDVFVHDRSTGTTERVSVDSAGVEGNSDSYSFGAAISAGGRFVVFSSDTTNLVAGDTNGVMDIFVHERAPLHASWSNYGTGWSGTNGVPSFTSQSNPLLGSALTLDLGNSSGQYTVGVLLLGFLQTTLRSTLGGDVLVEPVITQLVGLSPWGASLFGDLPNDDSLIGFAIDLQAIEADPGAAKGVSFTQGLELVLGH